MSTDVRCTSAKSKEPLVKSVHTGSHSIRQNSSGPSYCLTVDSTLQRPMKGCICCSEANIDKAFM